MALEIVLIVSLVSNVTLAYFLLRARPAKLKETPVRTDREVMMTPDGPVLVTRGAQSPGIYYNDGSDDDRLAKSTSIDSLAR